MTTMHNSEASLEFRDLRDGLSDGELKKVSGRLHRRDGKERLRNDHRTKDSKVPMTRRPFGAPGEDLSAIFNEGNRLRLVGGQSSSLRLPNDLPSYRWREKVDAHPVTTP